MRMLYCHKCGTAIIPQESLIQEVLEKGEEATRKAERGPRSMRNAYLHEAAQYRSVYKMLMHYITQLEIARTITPQQLKALKDEVLARGLMTEEEVQALYAKGRRRAEARMAEAEREERRVYGYFETIANRSKSDPTADAALDRIDRESQHRSGGRLRDADV